MPSAQRQPKSLGAAAAGVSCWRRLSAQAIAVAALCASCLWIGYVAGHAAAARTSGAAAAGAAAAAAATRALEQRGIRSAAEAWAHKPPPGSTAVVAAASAGAAAVVPRSALSACHRRLTSRGELPALLDALGLRGDGVEVGVREGDFSEHMLANWRSHAGVYHLVDPWRSQDKATYNDVSNVEQAEQDARYARVTATMSSRFPGRTAVHRALSVDAARDFADASLDFVYIDARHDAAGVLEDLRAWYPKLRPGGLFAGHDFVPDGIKPEGAFGVQGAVAAFAAEPAVNREVQSISDKNPDGGRAEPQHRDGGWTTFFWIK